MSSMKKVVFSTNLPSPYRVDFFNEFGKYCDLTVLYERKSSAERNASWKGKQAINFTEVYLDLKPSGVDLASGSALRDYVRRNPSDILIFTNYSSPATQKAITWCKLHGREYLMEYDGGFNKKDNIIKRLYKQWLLKGAKMHLTTADEHIKYLKNLGIVPATIKKYPFTSISDSDIYSLDEESTFQRKLLRKDLGLKEKQIIITVGRFSNNTAYRKGYDILMNVAKNLDSTIGVYIIGEEPTPEYVRLKEDNHLDNVHFVGFKNKDELARYYKAADLFILLSREDIWGLVINEAMAHGLPIITSDKCIAGLELVENDVNGYIVSLDNAKLIAEKIESIAFNPEKTHLFGLAGLSKIKDYTIEEMALCHKNILL